MLATRAALVAVVMLCIMSTARCGWFGRKDDKAKAYFDAMDKDSDGKLSEKEFFVAVQGTPLDPRQLSKEEHDTVVQLVRKGQGLDWNQWKELFEDSVDDMPELQEGGAVGSGDRQKGSEESIKEAEGEAEPQSWSEMLFRKHDKNRDGQLSRDEAHAFMSGTGEGDSAVEADHHEASRAVDELFSELDKDLSETISVEEWLCEGISSIFSGLMGNTHAYHEYEEEFNDLLKEEQDLSFQ